MPKILDEAVKRIQASGKSKDSAYAIATSTLQKAGDLDSHGEATAKGAARGKLGHSGRVKDRAAKGPVKGRK